MLPLSKLRKDPIFVLGGMIVMLTIVVGAGFLFLYYKSELDVKQVGNEIGIIRSMLATKTRLDSAKKRDAAVSGAELIDFTGGATKRISLDLKEHNAIKFAGFGQEETLTFLSIKDNKALMNVQYTNEAPYVIELESGVMQETSFAKITARSIDADLGKVTLELSGINTD